MLTTQHNAIAKKAMTHGFYGYKQSQLLSELVFFYYL